VPTLYNCKAAGESYRITKFDNEMNVESSYLCTATTCECPAGKRPHCRHREMLPKFLHRQHVGDEWFFDFDRGGWVQGWLAPSSEPEPLMPHSVADSTADFDSVSTGANPVGATKPAWRRF
jgi:hypothetical protein